MDDVAIIGGGIGGLTAAIALQRRGVEAHVYEAVDGLSEVGAGIWMPPNAMQVFERLGLAEAVMEAGAPIRRPELRDYRSGTLRVADLADGEQRWGWPTVSLHRARLQRILVEAVAPGTLHLGRPCRGVAPGDDRARVSFADGAEIEARIVVGADGIRSVVRAAIFPRAALRYSGQTSYRAVLPFELPRELKGVGWEIWAPGRRFGLSAISRGEVYWYATVDAPAGERDAPGALRPRLEAIYAGFPPLVGELVAATPEARILRTDISDLRPIPSWHVGRVVLLGDAAHATTPNLGQGAAQAIEDAWVLADRLAVGEDAEAALSSYERSRMPKARHVVRTSWRLGKLAHQKSGLGRWLRNALLTHMPASMARRQMEALYELTV